MPDRIVTPEEFDAVIRARFSRDEHELLESRFFDEKGRLIARVIRHLDENGELKPWADLVLPGQED